MKTFSSSLLKIFVCFSFFFFHKLRFLVTLYCLYPNINNLTFISLKSSEHQIVFVFHETKIQLFFDMQINIEFFSIFFYCFRAIWSSSSCSWAIGAGLPLMTSRPLLFLGKAIKSRMLSAPPKSEQRRSKQKASPAWGGAP